MLKVLKDKIKEHIISNLISYIILCVLFIVGIIGGAYIYNRYSQDDAKLLFDFFCDAKELYKVTKGNNLDIFKNALSSSFKTIILIWLLGFTVIGIPIVFFTIIKKGFIIGLLTNFLLTNYPDGGLIAFILLFIQSLILIPLMFITSTYSISLSKTLIGIVFSKIRFKVNLKYYLLFYMGVLFLATVVIVIYALLEAYFTGNIIRWYFINS